MLPSQERIERAPSPSQHSLSLASDVPPHAHHFCRPFFGEFVVTHLSLTRLISLQHRVSLSLSPLPSIILSLARYLSLQRITVASHEMN